MYFVMHTDSVTKFPGTGPLLHAECFAVYSFPVLYVEKSKAKTKLFAVVLVGDAL